MTAAYVRRHYGVEVKRGQRVTVDGRTGTVVSFPDQYLGVRFDGERRTSRCHPTWRVDYPADDSGSGGWITDASTDVGRVH